MCTDEIAEKHKFSLFGTEITYPHLLEYIEPHFLITILHLKLNLSISLLREILLTNFQKQPSRGVPRKRCSGNIQQIYRRTPMPKCDFNKVNLELH